jgi:hypothetical protein
LQVGQDRGRFGKTRGGGVASDFSVVPSSDSVRAKETRQAGQVIVLVWPGTRATRLIFPVKPQAGQEIGLESGSPGWFGPAPRWDGRETEGEDELFLIRNLTLQLGQ